MRKFLVVVLSAVLVCGLALAKDEPAVKAVHSDHLNNVIIMDASGHRTALCLCGTEFPVVNTKLALHVDDETLYCCSEGCHAMAAKVPADEQKNMAADFFKTKFPNDKMASNMYMKDGKKMATCLCGKTVEVNDKTPKITENGVTLYLCSDACNTALHSMSEADRMKSEMTYAAPSKSTEKKSQ